MPGRKAFLEEIYLRALRSIFLCHLVTGYCEASLCLFERMYLKFINQEVFSIYRKRIRKRIR
jgi:hypothetical protein